MTAFNVRQILGVNAVSMQKGKVLYDFLESGLRRSDAQILVVDFQGVDTYASPFFNVAFGLLVKDFSIDLIQERIRVTNISEFGSEVLNLCIENAVQFYSDPN
jgi:hypothetical protein